MSRATRLGDFVSSASFWRPDFVDATSYWLEHAPFAFWIVDAIRPSVVVELGTYSGFSYLSFCQAVAKLGLPSRTFAVDAWKGDRHMGEYGDEVLADLSTYHDERYSAFSQLIPSTFDDAVAGFEDASIDLLHIDGVHTYEAVRHDFETWAPKLSKHGVVLFHDTNVRADDFGVHRLWMELQKTHRGFEFVHGYGLGVLGVGSAVPAPIVALFDAHTQPALAIQVRDAYAQLGDVVTRDAELGRLKEALAEVEADTLRLADVVRTLEEQSGAMRTRLVVADAETRRLADVARTFEEQSGAMRTRLISADAELGWVRAELEDVLSSRSWRITAPLRNLTFVAKRAVARSRRIVRLRSRVRRLRRQRPGAGVPSDSAAPAWISPLDSLLANGGRKPSLLEFPGQADLAMALGDEAIIELASEGNRARQSQGAPSRPLAVRPLVSILMPTFETKADLLELAVDSVLRQTYTNWELVVLDDGSTSRGTRTALDRLDAQDSRIRIARNTVNRGIAQATNDALRLATGEYVALLDHDDELQPDALLEVMCRINDDPSIDVVYTDQDSIDADGSLSESLLKPDWSPTFFCGVMFVGHLLVVRRSVAEAVGGFDPAFDNVQDFEFMLRVSELTDRIAHVPKRLYRWRKVPGSVALHGDEKAGIDELQARAVTAHLARRGIAAVARPHGRHAHRTQFVVNDRVDASVTVVLWPTDDAASVERTVRGLSSYPNSGVSSVVIPGQVRHAVEDLETGFRLIATGGPWTDALDAAGGDFVLSLAPGLVPEGSAWIAQLIVHARDPRVAAVSSVVVDGGDRIDESGLALGLDGDPAAAMAGQSVAEDGYAGSLTCSREVSAVSGRSSLIRRDVLARVSDPSHLFADQRAYWIDLSLRACSFGLRNVVSSQSVVRRVLPERPSPVPLDALDAAVLRERWGRRLAAPDPYYISPRAHPMEEFGVPYARAPS